MKEQINSIIQTIPAAEALRKVPQFNPLRYLRRTTSKTGEPVLKFDLRYKKMWFRLACSDGRMVLNPMRITDTMAIFEAQVYLHRDDPRPITNFISTMYAKNVPGGRYVQAAQDEALNEALDNAGFGIQLSDLVESDSGSECGSEIPVEQVEHLLKEPVAQPVQSVQQESALMAEPVQATDETPEPTTVAAAEQNDAVNETAGVLQMLGAAQPSESHEPDPGTAQEQPVVGNTYTDDMPIEEITRRMTLDEARSILVTFGTCKGWTLGEVMERRASSLRFYLYSAKDAGNVLKAAASLLLEELAVQKAG